MRDENVRWLRQSLAALDPEYEGKVSDSDLFDAELERQLRSFQRRNRLQVDGLAGQQTQIFINSLLSLEGTPKLSSDR
jgi:general secretion pathway protein A